MENNEILEILPDETQPEEVTTNESELSNEEVVTDLEGETEPEPDTEITEEDMLGTVSGGDSVDEPESESGIVGDVIEVVLSAEQTELFEKNNELLTQLVEYQQKTIMDKPLARYTPTEGMLLILVVFALGLVLGRIIGGIIPCKQ